jgi:hypothetical protein
MSSRYVALAVAIAFTASVGQAWAQAQGQGPQSPTAVPVQLQIVIARYQGEKRVSSLPYILSLESGSGGRNAQLRMNGEVPVPATVLTPAADGKPATPSTVFNYRSIGTNIDVDPTSNTDGRFGFSLTVSESRYMTDGATPLRGVEGLPSFLSFMVTNAVRLKDGETVEFTAATDRITGEVTKVEVTLTVLE